METSTSEASSFGQCRYGHGTSADTSRPFSGIISFTIHQTCAPAPSIGLFTVKEIMATSVCRTNASLMKPGRIANPECAQWTSGVSCFHFSSHQRPDVESNANRELNTNKNAAIVMAASSQHLVAEYR